MPLGAQLLIVAVVVLWAGLVTHIALVVRIWRVREITTLERWIAPVFPFYPGWKYGLRKHAVLWACLIILYLVCRAGLSLR